MLARSRPSPQLGRGYRRIQNCAFRLTELPPLRKDVAVSLATNFDDDVGIDKDGHRFSNLSIRVPRRRVRTYSVESGKSARSALIPTRACMASRRSSKLPR